MDHDDVLEQTRACCGRARRARRGSLPAIRRPRPRWSATSRAASGAPRSCAASAVPRHCCATSSGRRRRPTSVTGRSPTSGSTVGRGARGSRERAPARPHAGGPGRPRSRPRASSPDARRILPWVATIAAVIALASASAGFLAYRGVADRMTAQATTSRPWRPVQRATLELSARSRVEARRARSPRMAAITGGTLLFSPATTKLVVVAYGLARPPSGQEYRCWVVVDGQRKTSAGCSSRTSWPTGSATRPRSARSAGRHASSACH